MDNDIADRLAAQDWRLIAAQIETAGHARTGMLLSARECAGLIALYDQADCFRSTIDMARYRFGEGQYRYFNYPLPGLVAALRRDLYRHLAPIANDMAVKLSGEAPYPPDLEAFGKICRDAGQTKGTPLLLRYEAGGYNRLHQDLYGAVHFPLQAVFLLSRRETDFTGGEFLLLEQQPRAQSIGQAITPEQGEMLIIPVRERPVQGKRGYYRAPVRHGVSRLHTGRRYTLGLIFHDAE
ncbi:MAG: 2OG-Fe(II) oxygenase [Proteobacteria bacterium]|nr:2OG-Fe(II) oxygenase [Pseudomonadota bacterium]